ncbi:MAG: 23S rRNA (guanosine(2251)-2'-O)-methyltransferase RlmB [Mycobacteriales bacterium]
MPGNSQRPNRRKPGTKKGAVVGSGGQRRRGLEGKGPTPPKEKRNSHPAAREAAAKKSAGRDRGRDKDSTHSARVSPGRRSRGAADAAELLVGRNPVVEALKATIPANTLYVALGIETDERVTEAMRLAGDQGLPLLEVGRAELDRMTGGVLHQGIALKVPPYRYTDYEDLLVKAKLLVALDGVTDPRNLGAIVRSAAAFGAAGVVIPQRRAASMTATAWRTSAGSAARLPVSKVTNLVRALKAAQDAGLSVIGLDADGKTGIDNFVDADQPVMIVVGSEGRGLSRLVAQTCDMRVSIPMAGATESLNASVAAAVALAEVARCRRS